MPFRSSCKTTQTGALLSGRAQEWQVCDNDHTVTNNNETFFLKCLEHAIDRLARQKLTSLKLRHLLGPTSFAGISAPQHAMIARWIIAFLHKGRFVTSV